MSSLTSAAEKFGDTAALESRDGRSVFYLRGERSVNSAADLHRLLRTVLEADDAEIEADLTEVVELDLSSIQLLWAAQQAAGRSGRKIALSGAPPAAAVERFRLSGLDPFDCCAAKREA
jgi:anti-anti-sigma regulatory factor